MESIVAIGDIHGMESWRDIVEKHYDSKIVFMGDYLDPYGYVTRENQLMNLCSIISLKMNRPHDVVLLEGILVFSEPKLRNMMDIKVFVDADADERLIRVIYRDCIERGRTPQMVIDRYERVLKPMHNQYIEPAKRYADLIVPQGGNNEVAINLLTDYIKSRLKGNSL